MTFNPESLTLNPNGEVVKNPIIPPALRARPDGSNPLAEVHSGPNVTIEVDQWTRHIIKREVESGGSFESSVALSMAPAWPTLVREMFAEMYDPTLPGLEAEDPTSEYIEAVREKAHEVPGWEALAESCVADGFRTGMAVDTIAQAIADNLPPPPNESPEDAMDAAAEAADWADRNPLIPGAEAHAEKMHQAAMDAADAMAAATQKIRADHRGGMRREMKKAVAKVAAQIAREEASMIVGGAGWGSGQGNAIDVVGPRRALIDAMRFNPTLGKIMELAGRMREFAKLVQKSKTTTVPEEVVDVELGGEWSRFVAAELVGLADEDLELHLMRRAVERGVFQYALEGNDNAAKGPIVFCLDESGSMQGNRDEYAKAAAFCMAEIAGREKRAFTLLHFASSVGRRDDYRPPTPMHVDQLIGMLTSFQNGGTDIDGALRAAADIVASEDSMGKADIILLSDGASGYPDKALRRCEEVNARVHGIAIGSAFPDELREACATYAEIHEVDEQSGAPDFQGLSGVFSV